MVWINLEDAVQVILFEQRERLVLASCGPRGGGGGRGGGVGGGALVSELSGPRDAGGGEAHPGCAGSGGALELRVIMMIMRRMITTLNTASYLAVISPGVGLTPVPLRLPPSPASTPGRHLGEVDAVPGAARLTVVAEVVVRRVRAGDGQPQHRPGSVQVLLRQSHLRAGLAGLVLYEEIRLEVVQTLGARQNFRLITAGVNVVLQVGQLGIRLVKIQPPWFLSVELLTPALSPSHLRIFPGAGGLSVEFAGFSECVLRRGRILQGAPEIWTLQLGLFLKDISVKAGIKTFPQRVLLFPRWRPLAQ